MKAHWRNRFRIARRTAIGLAILGVLAVVGVGAAMWRASWVVNQLLRDWATGIIAEQSGGVYQLDFGRVRFDWALRRVVVEAINLTTHRAINERRPHALPGLSITLDDCTISGVRFVRLITRAGLIAGSFRCRSGHVMLEVPPREHIDGRRAPVAQGPAEHASRERQTFLVFQQSVRLPSYAPRVRIARVTIQGLALEVRLPRYAGGATRLELEQLQWSMTNLAIDPADATAAVRPLFSRTIELVANNFITHPNHATAVRVGRLRASLTDSTLEIRGIDFSPSVSGPVPAVSRRHRERIRLTVGRITARGIDYGAFIVGRGVLARHVEVDSIRIDVTSDKRVPKGARGPSHLTPQQWIADLDETLRVDSLRVSNGQAVYRVHASGREQPGVLTFTRIEATAANVSHFAGRRTSGDPMTLTASARFQGAGQLEVRVVMPLDAPQFDMTLRGTLGAMPAPVLNTYVVETGALRIEHGQVAGISFGMTVRNGVATGTVTPRFNDLSLSVRRSGSVGILGSGGILGGAARGVASLAAGLQVRADNPDHRANAPRVGAIGRTFTPDQTLLAFLWSGARDGLLHVVRK